MKKVIPESDSTSKSIIYTNSDLALNKQNVIIFETETKADKNVKLYEGKSGKLAHQVKTQDSQITNAILVRHIMYSLNNRKVIIITFKLVGPASNFNDLCSWF